MEFKCEEVPTVHNVWEVKHTLWAIFKCIGQTGNYISIIW